MADSQLKTLTTEQKAEYKKAFDLLDKNKDGSISTKELEVAMVSIGLTPSEDELEAMVKKADIDENGTLNFDEFLAMVLKIFNKNKLEELKKLFLEYDINNDGTITVEELRQIFKSDDLKIEGFCRDDLIIEQMLKEADFDKDGKINIEG